MVPPGPPTPLGGSQSVPSSLLRSNSGLLGGQGGSMPPQSGFPSLVSQHTQFNNRNMLANVTNSSSLLHQSYGNGGPGSGISVPGSSQRGIIDTGSESDPPSIVGNGMGFDAPSTSFGSSNMIHPNASSQVPVQQCSTKSGNQISSDQQQQAQQLESQNFQQSQQLHQHSFVPNNNNHHQQQQYSNIQGGLGSVGQVKLETQVATDQHRQTPQQLQAMRNIGPVKMELQHIQSMKNLPPVKVESQHSDQSLFLLQQQQQQFLNMSRQSPQAAAAAAQINILHQQRFLQLHQQQRQLLKNIPQQRPSMQPQFQQQNLALRSPAKPVYEPGTCARRLTHYMYQQQHRPEDNSIEFWRKFVAEYFAPNAKKKWCVSLYGNGRHTTGVFPQDIWHCEICNKKPGRGFEATVEVLPRLFKIKYESGTLEELLYVDMPREYQNCSGQIVLDYAKAIQESVFEQLRVVRDGQLRIVFSADLKICSWEFCARHHEELIPRRLLIPQVSQLGNAAQKYQASMQNASSNLSVPELQNSCNMFVASARLLAKALDVPLVNDLGYTKRYVRCLQISEVVNSMKDLIDYSGETGIGPMESLANFPRRTSMTSGSHSQPQQPEQQQTTTHNTSNNETCGQGPAIQVASTYGMSSVNNSNPSPLISSNGAIAGLPHQNPKSSRQQPPLYNANSPYGGGSGIQIPCPGSSSKIPQPQTNPSPFQSPTRSLSNNAHNDAFAAVSAGHLNSAGSPNTSMQQPALSSDADLNDSQSSVQKIIHEMMSSQLGGGDSMGNDMKNMSGLTQTGNNLGLFGGMGGGGCGQPAMVNGVRAATGHDSLSMNGRVAMSIAARGEMNNHHHYQLDPRNQLLHGLGAVNGQ